jgi:Calcineurin-like phosphoesterase
MRSLIVGDIHGMHDELMRVLEMSGYSDSDRLICLGDYIDRGERSREVMEFLIQAKRRNPENVYLLGNHERVVLNALAGKPHALDCWLDDMYGRETVESYGKQVPRWSHGDPAGFVGWVFPEEHLKLVMEMPESCSMGKYLCVHDVYDAEGMGNENRVVIHAHEHGDRPVMDFMRICLGLDDRVAVLDLNEMAVWDSDGVRYEVDMRAVQGPLHGEYW